MPRRVLVILLAYGRSHHAWDVVCLHHLQMAFIGQERLYLEHCPLYHDSHMTPRVTSSSDSDSGHANGITSCLEIEMSH